MTGHLAKAKGALDAARDVTHELNELDEDDTKTRSRKTAKQIELLEIARAQALVAIAESVARIEEHLTYPPMKIAGVELRGNFDDDIVDAEIVVDAMDREYEARRAKRETADPCAAAQ